MLNRRGRPPLSGGRCRPAAARHRARRGAARRSFPPGCPVGRPDTGRHHAAHGARRRRGQGQRPARGRDRRGVPQGRRQALDHHQRSAGYSVKARVTGLKPHERYYYRFETQDVAVADRALPDRAAGRLQRAGALRASSPARTTRTATTTPTSCWSARTSTSSSASATTSTPRATTPRAGPACATTRSARPTATTRRSSARPSRSPTTAPSTRSIAPTRRCATCTPSSRWSRPGTTTRCRTTTRATRPAAACDAGQALRGRAQGRGLQGVLRGDAVLPTRAGAGSTAALRFGKNVDLVMLDQRQYRDDQPCGDATVPPCAELDPPRAFLGRAQMDWAKQPPRELRRRLEGRRQRGDDDERRAARRRLLRLRLLAGLPRRARGAARAHPGRGRSRTSSSSRATSTRSSPATSGRRRAAGESVALEFVGGSITSQSLGETDLPIGGGQVLKGNDANPNTPRRSSTPCAGSTRGSTRPTSTTTATAS